MKISVQKYNPSVDAEPYFGTYEIEHTEHCLLYTSDAADE